MDKSMENKRFNADCGNVNLTNKMRKIDRNQDVQTTSSPHQHNSNVMELNSSDLLTSIGDKMNNIVKLRQQYVKEIEAVEVSSSKLIKELKSKISKANKKADTLTNGLKQSHKSLFDESEIIYKEEQKNGILRQKVNELYEYQKLIWENMEDISNALSVHGNLADRLTNDYDSLILMLENNNAQLQEEICNVVPDEKFSTELNEINLAIEQQEKEKIEYENILKQLELELKTRKTKKQEEQNKIDEQNKIITDLEAKNKAAEEKAEEEKKNILKDLEQLQKEVTVQLEEITKSENNVSELKNKLEIKRADVKASEKSLEDLNDEIILLSEESKKLDKIQDANNTKSEEIVQNLSNQIKNSQGELDSLKEKEHQAINYLQKKNSELRAKFKSYESLELQLKKLEDEKKKEEEELKSISKTHENRKKQYNNQITLVDNKILEFKSKIQEMEHNILKDEENVKILNIEISKLNEKYQAKLKIIEETKQNSLKKNIDQYTLPNLYDEIGIKEKQTSRKTLYTPTLADDDLKEIDSLSLEDQVTQLCSQAQSSPQRTNKFFKRSSLSQLRSQVETTPRGKSRSKKN